MNKLLLLSFCLWMCNGLLFIGCGTTKQAGGKGTIQRGSNTNTVQQPENPMQAATQRDVTKQKTTFTIPAGTPVEQKSTSTDPAGNQQTNTLTFIPNKPVPVETETISESDQSIGAAQKDTVGELKTTFKALAPLMIFSLACLAGAGALAYFGRWKQAIIPGAMGIIGLILYVALPQFNPMYFAVGAGIICTLLVVMELGGYDKNRNFIPDALENNKKK